MSEQIMVEANKVYTLIRNGVRYQVKVKAENPHPMVVGGLEVLVESIPWTLYFLGWIVAAELEELNK